MTDVSILMNCYNSETYLRDAIDSIYSQTYKDWEIIFVDNCSSDKSASIAKACGEKVKYCRTTSTVPLGGARIFGLRKCKGKYIAFLDSDDLWNIDLLSKSIAVLDGDNSIGFTYSNIELINHQGNILKRLFQKRMPSGNIFPDLIKGYFIPMVSAVVRRDVVDSIIDRINPGYEVITDLELFTRIAYICMAQYIPDTLACYRIHDKSLTSKKRIKFPTETENFLSNLSNEIPELSNDYGEELSYVHTTIAYQYALCHWQNNDMHEARKLLRKVLFKRKKYLIPYLFTFFSYDTFIRLKSFLKVGMPR